MPLENAVAARLNSLILDAERLRGGDRADPNESVHDRSHLEECSGWLVSAVNLVRIVCPDPGNPFRKRTEEIAERNVGWLINHSVGELGAILKNLTRDIDAGLLTSIADRARAETFDDFLDHGRAYLDEGRKQEAGVICGVVFEDTVRRICRKHRIEESSAKLDTLISALARDGVLSGTKAKRARVAADVRTKATHAQWDEFDSADVSATILITQELIAAELDQ